MELTDILGVVAVVVALPTLLKAALDLKRYAETRQPPARDARREKRAEAHLG